MHQEVTENLQPLVPLFINNSRTDTGCYDAMTFVIVFWWSLVVDFLFGSVRLISLVAADPMMISNEPLENTGTLAAGFKKMARVGSPGRVCFCWLVWTWPWGYQVLYFDMIYILMSAGAPRTRRFCHGDLQNAGRRLFTSFYCGLFPSSLHLLKEVAIFSIFWRLLGRPRWCTIHLWQVWSSLVCQGVLTLRGSKCGWLQVILLLQF